MFVDILIGVIVFFFVLACYFFLQFLFYNFKALQNIKAKKGLLVNLIPFLALSKDSFNDEGRIYYSKSWKSFFYGFAILITIFVFFLIRSFLK
ncbi:hypothetical protein [Thiomicrorhabdus sp.]|uniref:hypothetical protein n=1 Tax=Thiomicrorhabdus sp. TaxID=2039724 RepID=UPI0029C66BFD|nr:hypothetical protein [Thiomicrorhabdus sp.]